MSENLFEKLQAGFPAERERAAIELPDGRVHSYADLEAASGRFARLLEDLGVVQGDRVAVQVEKSAEALFLYLACLRAGAIYLPLNTAYTRPRSPTSWAMPSPRSSSARRGPRRRCATPPRRPASPGC